MYADQCLIVSLFSLCIGPSAYQVKSQEFLNLERETGIFCVAPAFPVYLSGSGLFFFSTPHLAQSLEDFPARFGLSDLRLDISSSFIILQTPLLTPQLSHE